ncbi:MAG: tungstate ABC transporter substrate-binding protein WtpA [Firmicutes bacterium]|nr:tungstate ABC transporter substrate-binding protein WtpA [Bacillota bacterium]
MLLIGVGMTGVLLAGCGGGSAGSQNSSGNTPASSVAQQGSETVQQNADNLSGTLRIFAAGSLGTPFKQIDAAFSKEHPHVNIQLQTAGSVLTVKKVTEQHQPADVVAVADYSVIPQLMMPTYTDWYIEFANNQISIAYTDKSKGADQITPQNWYQILSQPGVKIGRSNPDTDPSGYQALQMLQLTEKYYKQPGLYDKILQNSPKTYIRDTETNLVGALEAGQIDYLFIYTSNAKQEGLKYVDLPPQLNLSDPSQAQWYAQASVTQSNGTVKKGIPILYAVTIPKGAPNEKVAEAWIGFLLGPQGQQILQQAGQGILKPAIANDPSKVPETLRPFVAS